jgi:hypothetical protein
VDTAGSGSPSAPSGAAATGAETGSVGASGEATSGAPGGASADAGDDSGPASSGDDAGPGGGSEDGGTSTVSACPMLTTGWNEYHPMVTVQFEDGSFLGTPQGAMMQSQYCTYTNSGGIELFKMLKDPAGRIQRCEARVLNEYTTGSNQFEGDVRVTAGNATCVHQVFLFLMLDAFPANGGEFHEHTGALLETGVFSKWVHVNTIHHVASGKADIYLDCVMKGSAPARAPTGTGWYNKYGVYAVNHAPPVEMMAQSEWKNVKFYRQ